MVTTVALNEEEIGLRRSPLARLAQFMRHWIGFYWASTHAFVIHQTVLYPFGK
jgi:hypothetical protein